MRALKLVLALSAVPLLACSGDFFKACTATVVGTTVETTKEVTTGVAEGIAEGRKSGASIDGALTRSTMLLRSSPRSRKTRWSPNWRLPSTRQTLRPRPCSAIAALIAMVVVPTPPLAP